MGRDRFQYVVDWAASLADSGLGLMEFLVSSPISTLGCLQQLASLPARYLIPYYISYFKFYLQTITSTM
jgi:hypothetical protein